MKAVVLDDAGAYVRDCAVGEVGVLVIRGPNVFAGYRDARAQQGTVARCRRRRAMAEHRRPRPPGRGRLLLPDRPKEGTDHPRRPQHRPGKHRGAAAPASGRADRRRGRPARRARRRAAGRLCAAQAGRRVDRGGTACPSPGDQITERAAHAQGDPDRGRACP